MSVGNVKLNVTGGSASYDHISSTSTADDADIDEEVIYEAGNRESRVKKLTKKVLKSSSLIQHTDMPTATDHQRMVPKKSDNAKSKEKARILPKNSLNRPPKYNINSDRKQHLLNHETSDNSAMLQPVETFDIKQQLLKDGFRLDEISDDEELDLIPPRVITQEGCCKCCCTIS